MTQSTTVTSETHEQQLRRLTMEVEALRRRLQTAQKLATVGTMTAMVAHEFNNILTPIINYAQLARNNPALTEKAIARAAEGGQRASNICNAILNFTKDDSQEPTETHLTELVRQTIEAMGRDPQRDAIELTVDIPPSLSLATRPTELQQILLNLLLNARAAVLDGTGPRSISIGARRTDQGVAVEVRDSGVGINPQDLPRIFDPFFTTRDSPESGAKGHGLGLTFCRDAIADLGGRISVTSTPGSGAAFTVHLPGR